jgi:hypothetical protein
VIQEFAENVIKEQKQRKQSSTELKELKEELENVVVTPPQPAGKDEAEKEVFEIKPPRSASTSPKRASLPADLEKMKKERPTPKNAEKMSAKDMLKFKRSFFVRMVSDPKIYNPKIVRSLSTYSAEHRHTNTQPIGVTEEEEGEEEEPRTPDL